MSGCFFGWQTAIMEAQNVDGKLWRPEIWMASYGGWQIMEA